MPHLIDLVDILLWVFDYFRLEKSSCFRHNKEGATYHNNLTLWLISCELYRFGNISIRNTSKLAWIFGHADVTLQLIYRASSKMICRNQKNGVAVFFNYGQRLIEFFTFTCTEHETYLVFSEALFLQVLAHFFLY